jgi:HicA-like toxin of HicAB toxin-antitoxin system
MSRPDETLRAIFADPIRANISWKDIEALFKNRGGEVSKGQGSRVRVRLNGVRATFHRPHPQHEAHKPLVRSVRRFLELAGVVP